MELIQKMPYWATSYSFGWLIGVSFLANWDLFTDIEIVVSTIILIVFLLLRFVKWWRL